MKKATTIRKLITLSLCLMMCLSVFAPASVFAKCSHKNTKLVVLKEVTCTRNGKCVNVVVKKKQQRRVNLLVTNGENGSWFQ